MKKFQIFLIYFIFSFLIVGVGFVSSQISEKDIKNLNYPIVELGNCKDQTDCEEYCDKSENATTCLNFAEANNLMTREEIDMARKLLAVGVTAGPGGCKGEEECNTYCDIPANMEECLTFALDNDLIPPEERPDAEKALAAIKKGATPPPCRGKAACDEYCTKPENLEICLPFAEAAGFITPGEAEMIRKTGGQGPGGCKGKDACEAYCQQSTNMEECINFGLQYGLIPAEEAEEAQKALEAIKKGINPPNCRGREECDLYCSQPEHFEECINFAEAAGFMTAEEAEMAKKMAKAGLFSGPGGCKGKEECETYCENPDNMSECVDFAVKAGMMTPEEAEQAKKMAALGITSGPGGCKSKEECEAFCQDPANGQECMNFALQTGLMTPEEVEQARKMMELEVTGGPGDCKGQEECESYCADPNNNEECMNFAIQMGIISPEEAEKAKMMGPEGPGGPGGCRSQEECEVYCQDPSHLEECFDFSVDQEMITPEEVDQMKEMMEQQMMLDQPSGGIMPPEGMTEPPSEAQIQEQIEQQMEQEIQQQIEQQIEQQMAPPPTEVPPQSLFEQSKYFLANLFSAFISAFSE